jgi:hypothetical protein
LPPEPFALPGINGYLRFKEWKAGPELRGARTLEAGFAPVCPRF